MKKERVNFYIEKEDKEKLDKRALELKTSYSNIIRKLIKDYFNRKGE